MNRDGERWIRRLRWRLIVLLPQCGRRRYQIVSDIRRETKARLGMNINVECHPEGTLPRYEAKATRVLHRAEAR